jgi:hypothetical protein
MIDTHFVRNNDDYFNNEMRLDSMRLNVVIMLPGSCANKIHRKVYLRWLCCSC